MKHSETQQFFADFCEADPDQAHILMMHMINNPTGGVQFTLPCLVSEKDFTKYCKETHALAKKYILNPKTQVA